MSELSNSELAAALLSDADYLESRGLKSIGRAIRLAAQRIEEIEKISEALGESLNIQAHYAALLNQYDGGKRLVFRNVDEWMSRLAALKGGEP
jgi:hypothetical protein